jgi:endonuclease/exonuclease/phosphatase (EEP) superfamily protein YafD
MTIRKVTVYFISFIGSLVIIASLLSLFYNLPYWYSKMLDFPRLQFFIVGVSCLILIIILTRKWKWPSILLCSGLIAAVLIQSIRIFPYWFGDKTVPDAGQNISAENSFSMMLANVLITNRQSGRILEVVKESNPDIFIVMEVDQWWLDELKVLKKDYPYVIEQPNDVAYGMALYSKLSLKKTEVKYLKHKNVSSFHSAVVLKSGKEFMLHSVHPVAPMPSDEYPDNIGDVENELIKVGEFVANEKLPSMVAGDFNDVSWSNTARLFEEEGELNNIRLGRGLYNTFDANSFLFRWPLDHFYVTDEFRLIDIKRLDKIGSDHFPMYASFLLLD